MPDQADYGYEAPPDPVKVIVNCCGNDREIDKIYSILNEFEERLKRLEKK